MKNKKNIRLLMAFNFFVDFRIYAPFAIIYYTSITNSIALGMSIFSITILSSIISEIPTGIISDNIGRKRTMILGALSFILAVLFYVIASSYFILAIGAIFEGIAYAFYSGNNDALLYDILENEKQTKELSKYIGKTQSMFQLALAISCLLGGALSLISIKTTVMLTLIPKTLCLLFVLFIDEPKKQSKINNPFLHFKDSLKTFWKNRKLRKFSINSAINSSVIESSYDISSIFINLLWPVWAIGIHKFIRHVCGTIGFWLSEKIIKKIKIRKSLVLSNSFMSLFNLIALIFKSIFSPILIALSSLGLGLNDTSVITTKQLQYKDKYRATMGSIDNLIYSIMYTIIAMILGFIADYSNVTIAMIVVNLLSIYTIIMFNSIFKNNNLELSQNLNDKEMKRNILKEIKQKEI